MEYKRKDNQIFFRLNKGEEVIEQITAIAKKENIKLASIEAIGATDEFVIGVYSVTEKKYYSKSFKGEYEITSLLGNISLKEGETYIHLHINCSSRDYVCVGGHLNKCIISATLEGVIKLADLENKRVLDKNTGINLLILD